ncbi:MAG: hypothetical protein H0V93_14695 [Euzebyales bacterium]|nr:hypothetical protein [Euzebyales bacterium]
MTHGALASRERPLSATMMAAAIRERCVSPVELVADALARLEASEPELNAFSTSMPRARWRRHGARRS